MKTNLLKKAQIALLLAAVAVAGSAFLPTESQAVDPTEECEWYCNGGGLPCGRYWDPVSETWEKCWQDVDCF
ncbi:MAG: hypothetical protein V3T72_08900 [Thermoanaerobaculia bacterium]